MFNVLALSSEENFLLELKNEFKRIDAGFFYARNLDIAYEIFNLGIIDFIIIDCILPKTDCFTIIKSFYDKNKNFKIIIIDNHADTEGGMGMKIDESFQGKENIMGILKKPADIECLIDIIKSYYDDLIKKI